MRPKHLVMTFAGIILFMFFAAPGWAGEEHKKIVKKDEYKCTMSTQECLNKMTEHLKQTGWVGIEYEPQKTGYWKILRVVPESPAEAAGLQPDDVIFAMNGIEFSEKNEKKLKMASKDRKPGVEITYTVKRGGQDKDISLTLAPMPADVMAGWIGHHMMDHAQAGDLAAAKP